MNEDFITIREATELTGKARITIRRLIKDLLLKDNPEATQMIRKEQTGEGFIYKISKAFLLKELEISEPDKPVKEQEKKEPAEPQGIIKEVLGALKEQLKVKDKQIEGLGNKIDNLIERDRETNIILNRLQEKVFFLEAPQKKRETTQTTKETEKAPESPPQPATSEVKEQPEKPKKPEKEKGFWDL